MKTSVSILLLACSFSSPAQVQPVSGYYAGEFSTDSVCIRVCFELNRDSSYKLQLAYNFTEFCIGKGRDTLLFEGRWKTEQDWLFLYPFNKGVDIFYQYETRSKRDKKIIAKNAREDMVAMEIETANDCPRIYFRINAECFRDAWKYNYIEKISCQAESPNTAK